MDYTRHSTDFIHKLLKHALGLNILKIEPEYRIEDKLFGNTMFMSKGGKFRRTKKQINIWRWLACSLTILYTAVMNVY